VIEIVRVLHERMEPSRHLDELPARRSSPQASEVWWRRRELCRERRAKRVGRSLNDCR
jgi:hypothetical protein